MGDRTEVRNGRFLHRARYVQQYASGQYGVITGLSLGVLQQLGETAVALVTLVSLELNIADKTSNSMT